jgi:magnesium transporter
MDHLREAGAEAEMLHTIYVVDERSRLLDHIRLRSLVLAREDELCEALREGQVVSLHADDDRESAVQMMERYDLPVLPVVEEDGVMVGIVTFDDVADVASEETTEDIHKLGGLDALETAYLSTPLTTMARKRGVWLTVLFFAGLLTVSAMGFFHEQLQERAILALFVPLIIASGGNSGSQAATLIVRALATGDVRTADWLSVFKRELVSGLMLGSVLGVVGLVVATGVSLMLPAAEATGFADALMLGLAIGTAVVGVVITGVLVGSMLPIGLVKLGADPATCSTPFVATVVDVAGLVIYFSVATIILRI